MRRGDFPPRGSERSVSDSGTGPDIRRCESYRFALVVQDKARAAEVKGTMLEANGWSGDTARDGFEAILYFRARTPGALLLDDQLPGMDGVDVFDWVRRNVVNTREVLVVSSECRDFLQSRFSGMGVRAILPKTLTAHDLIGALPS